MKNFGIVGREQYTVETGSPLLLITPHLPLGGALGANRLIATEELRIRRETDSP